jgi:putative Ig domain-containing protein/cellulase (glycosyl hydrolase family 5)
VQLPNIQGRLATGSFVAALLVFTGLAPAGAAGRRSAPRNTSPPTISGIAEQGETLSASTGSWTGLPTITYSYQWRRCDSAGANCKGITGASSQTYTLAASDVNRRLRVDVTGTNSVGSRKVTSAATAIITVAPIAPVATSPPAISGSAQQGQTLSASTGSWNGTPTINYGYQWRRCDGSGGNCASISGATSQTYTAITGDVSDTLRVDVTGTNGAGSNTATSAPTAIVTAPTTISPSTLPGATVGAAYTVQLAVSGPNPPYSLRVSSGTLPGGLTLTVGGVLSGAPIAGGSFTFTVSATDASNVTNASQGLTLTVTSPSGPRLPGVGIAAGADLQTWTSTNLNRQLDDYGRIHARWIRHDFAWDAIQPLQATFNWGGFDQLVSAARVRNINVIATITYTPAWANGGHSDHRYQPSSASQFAQFAGQVAARYAPQGVHTYEIWNEPNIGFWQPVPNPSYYAQVLCASYQAIHSADPQAVVVTGGTSPAADSSTTVSPQTWLSKLYANGAKSCFDAVGHHPYVDASNTHGDLGNAWNLMYDAYPPSNLRGIMSTNGDSAKRIFATEVGCDRVRLGDAECSYRIQEAMQLWSSFSWAGVVAWFIYWDPNVYGLVDGNWNPRPEWSSYQSGATTYFG